MKAPGIDVFQVIADPSRRKMLRLLSRDKLPINGLAEHFAMSRPAVSKHIKILAGAGFIRIEAIGRERYCSLHPEGFKQVQAWLAYFDKFWPGKLQRLDRLINRKQ